MIVKQVSFDIKLDSLSPDNIREEILQMLEDNRVCVLESDQIDVSESYKGESND